MLGAARGRGRGIKEYNYGVSSEVGASLPNKGMQATAYSVRCAPAARRA